MAGLHDGLDPPRVPLGDPARHEKPRADPAPFEQREQLRDGYLRPIRPLRQHAGPVGVVGVLADPYFFGVKIERERGGAARSTGPHASWTSVSSRLSHL